ncbi:MAG: hypothetical protein H7A45_20700 [Verrucomicrobiales bacterium]|nr:hypothetical protein [Verrucomicrobiales bacterium]
MNPAAVNSVFRPVSPTGEMAALTENRVQTAGHGAGHDLRQEFGTLFGSGLLSTRNLANVPDIYADI